MLLKSIISSIGFLFILVYFYFGFTPTNVLHERGHVVFDDFVYYVIPITSFFISLVLIFEYRSKTVFFVVNIAVHALITITPIFIFVAGLIFVLFGGS